jgi:hypothetical protein
VTTGVKADDAGGAGAVAPGSTAGRATGGRGRSKAAGAKTVEPVGGAAVGPAVGGVRGPAPDGYDAPLGDADTDAAADGEPGAGRRRRPPAAERREAARALIDAWRVVARDLAVASVGGRRQLRDAALLEEVGDVAGRLPAGSAVAFLARLEATERLVEANASPELAIDTLLLAWPRAAARPVGAHRAPAMGGGRAPDARSTADGPEDEA